MLKKGWDLSLSFTFLCTIFCLEIFSCFCLLISFVCESFWSRFSISCILKMLLFTYFSKFILSGRKKVCLQLPLFWMPTIWMVAFIICNHYVPSEFRLSAPRHEFGFCETLQYWQQSRDFGTILICVCLTEACQVIYFLFGLSQLKVLTLGHTGQSPPDQEVGQRSSCHISFNSAGLPESSGDKKSQTKNCPVTDELIDPVLSSFHDRRCSRSMLDVFTSVAQPFWNSIPEHHQVVQLAEFGVCPHPITSAHYWHFKPATNQLDSWSASLQFIRVPCGLPQDIFVSWLLARYV